MVTFTNAAASEMREKILKKLYEKSEQNPENTNLQKQIVLISKANICTIDAFCLEVIKNNFYKLDINPSFKIAEGTEIDILKQEVLEEIFEEKYLENSQNFKHLIDTYTGIRGDDSLKELILKIFDTIQSNPYPVRWLEEKIEYFNLKETEEDFSKNIYGNEIINYCKQELEENIRELELLIPELETAENGDKHFEFVKRYKYNQEQILSKIDNWDNALKIINSLIFDDLPRTKIDEELKIKIKNIASKTREIYKKMRDIYFTTDSKSLGNDMSFMYELLLEIKNIIIEFSNRFLEKKKEKNILDFNDIEHYALEVLLENDKPTDAAIGYRNKFNEILIDEYQDSNLVQEYILWSVSNGKNVFMVGDVKQSIYKFRQARPDLFLEKYHTYVPIGMGYFGTTPIGTKIKLYKNFRSRNQILDFVNLIFENIMSESLGDIEYTKEEFLNYGANYKDTDKNIVGGKTELHVIDLKEKETLEESDDEETALTNIEIEAKFVAKKITDLINSKALVTVKTGQREIMHKDIVILFRGTKNNAPKFEEILSKASIPVYSDASSEYLGSMEISTIMSLLKIIDNPLDDIAFVTVLRSNIGKFTDNELVDIRLLDKEKYMYENFKTAGQENIKCKEFLDKLQIWQSKQEFMPLDQFIWMLYLETGYYDFVKIMPDGLLKQANLKILFQRAKQYEETSFKGLFNFIQYIEHLKNSDNDLETAKLISENENVVRIMSIHKSKGLEFPVVFLSGTGIKFNLRDLSGDILIHQKLGIGPEYINYDRRITYPTMAKEAIKIVLKEENLSEEMRILYVALTRAKEKLIISGVSSMEISQSLLLNKDNGANSSSKKLSPTMLLNCRSFLDWILLVIRHNSKDVINNVVDIHYHQKEEVLAETIAENIQVEEKQNELTNEIEYKYENTINIPSKLSVTQLKQNNKQNEYLRLNTAPKFLNEDIKLSGAQIGTTIHYIIQKLENRRYSLEQIKELVIFMQNNNMITKIQADSIDINKILNFTKSEIFNRMITAKQIYKETPFYINISSNEIYEGTDENILVQGIIDCYFIDKDNKLVLIDYKTDYIKNNGEKELIEKYKEQLELYKKALEMSLQRDIDEIYIYSTCLDKEVLVPMLKNDEK